jgi:hypothetical protein
MQNIEHKISELENAIDELGKNRDSDHLKEL